MKTKAQRNEEALERQAAHDRLNLTEKLAKTFERPGNSARERELLLRATLA